MTDWWRALRGGEPARSRRLSPACFRCHRVIHGPPGWERAYRGRLVAVHPDGCPGR